MTNSITQAKVQMTLGNEETSPANQPRPFRMHWESIRIEAVYPGELVDSTKPVEAPAGSARSGGNGTSDPTQQEPLGKTTETVKQKPISQAAPRKKPVPTAKGNSSEVTADHLNRDTIPEFVKEINANHFLAYDGCQTRVFRESTDPITGKWMLDSLSLTSFKHFHSNQHVEITVDGKVKLKLKGHAWLENEERRQFDGIAMAPLLNIPRYYNRWKGFSVEPVQGSWQPMKDHILNNICAKDRVHYKYLIGWIAKMIQEPGTAGQVAVVLIGGRGTGKSFLGNCLCDLLGHHAQHVTGSEHVTGKFNGHLEDCIFLFADEANFAGDRQGGVLKGIITEPELPIHGKYKKLKGVPNMIHLLMASNDDFVVPAGNDERRFFVLNVSDARQQDLEYFGAIDQEMKSGGLEAMLYDLQNHDLSGFEVRNVPQTQGLLNQKRLAQGRRTNG
jgi:uncharacterized membrane protein YeaQ/YmgE (transglycosylase-associated protein family)